MTNMSTRPVGGGTDGEEVEDEVEGNEEERDANLLPVLFDSF